MEYVSIFSPIPWKEVGITVLQTFTLYWILVFGLKLVGRRVFGELGPQDLIVLLLIAESTNQGLFHQDAGFWGTVASALTILVTGATIERIPRVKKLFEGSTLELVRDGQVIPGAMKHCLVEKEDLEKAARQYGLPNISAFERMTLEGDGSITGVVKPEFRMLRDVEPLSKKIT